jgi:hypothetical protein
MMCFSSVELRKQEVRETPEYRKYISERFDRNTAVNAFVLYPILVSLPDLAHLQAARARFRERQEAERKAEELDSNPETKRKVGRRPTQESLDDADLLRAM